MTHSNYLSVIFGILQLFSYFSKCFDAQISMAKKEGRLVNIRLVAVGTFNKLIHLLFGAENKQKGIISKTLINSVVVNFIL